MRPVPFVKASMESSVTLTHFSHSSLCEYSVHMVCMLEQCMQAG
jgi:hypothetical protein